MTLIGPHIIGVPGDTQRFLDVSKCTVAKYLDPPNDPNLPKAPITIGRVYELSEQKDLTSVDPKTLGAAHAAALDRKSVV